MYICHRYSGKKLSEIGARFGVTESAMTQASRRIRDRRYGAQRVNPWSSAKADKDKKPREINLKNC